MRSGGERAWGSKRAAAVFAAVVLVALAGRIAPAGASACPAAAPTYLGPCGPTFVLPQWGDAGGWKDADQYSTIQLADVDGDGKAELLGRSDAGLQIWRFDTTLGQWRPQVDAKDNAQVLTDFASPRPSAGAAGTWTQPQYYSTIQTADVDGRPGKEVLARFPDGMHVYTYVPPAGGGIDGGTWKLLAQGGPFSDADGYGKDPSLYSTIKTADLDGKGGDELIARSSAGVVAYRWNGSGWTQLATLNSAGDDAAGQKPQFYRDIVAGHVLPGPAEQVLTRQVFDGVSAFGFDGASWAGLPAPGDPLVFGDSVDPVEEDCPFTAQTQDCLGSSPSYYETLQLANVDGQPGDELLARATDGLRVRTWGGAQSGFTGGLPTLAALAGDSSLAAGTYGTIQTANLDGKGGREVLALTATGLHAWTYDPKTQQWSALPGDPLGLTADPWMSDPSYYGTIQTGDVDGDGHDDVIARGPFGIRTFFYDRRGTGGWERYSPNGYPAFPTSGQRAAFGQLTTTLQTNGYLDQDATSIRDAWDGENAPTATSLGDLRTGVVRVADCTGPSTNEPTTYASCTKPPGSPATFTAADWTAVVDESLREVFSAQQVLAHFQQVTNLENAIFVGNGAELPAIGSDLQLQAEAATQTSYDLQQYVATVIDILGSFAGVAEGGAGAGAALAITGDVLSSIPSATPSLNQTYQTTYAGVAQQFADAVSGEQKALAEHSQDVRSDYGLTTLLAQLVQRGTWQLNTDAAASAGRWGFALWAYQSLLPGVYSRYAITSCTDPNDPEVSCSGPSAGTPGVIGGVPNFTALGPSPQNIGTNAGTPCQRYFDRGFYRYQCQYTTLPAATANLIWAPVSPTCNYQPGNANTIWTFGCSVGADLASSVGENGPGWNLNTYVGNFAIGAGSVSSGSIRGVGTRHARMSLKFPAVLPRSLDTRRLRVRVDRFVHERDRLGELVDTPGAVRLGRRAHATGGGRLYAGGGGRRPAVRLRIRRRVLVLSVRRARLPVPPGACQRLPASLDRHPDPVLLTTRIHLARGRQRRTLDVTLPWRCERGDDDVVHSLRLVRPKRAALRRGLGLAKRRLPAPAAGARRFALRVTNHLHGRGRAFYRAAVRVRSPFTQLRRPSRGGHRRRGQVAWRLGTIRPGHGRTLRITVRARRGSGRRCGVAQVTAVGARAHAVRLCAPRRAR